MKNRGYMEQKHGSADYPFEKFNVISDAVREFAINHWHSEIEIVFVRNGEILININGNEFVGKKGDIFVINGGEMHEIYGKESPLNYTAFVFDAEMLKFRTESTGIFEVQFLNKPEITDEAFRLLDYVDRINDEKSDCFEILTRTVLLQFFVLLVKSKSFVSGQAENVEDEKRRLLKDIVWYIEENFAVEITLLQIAKQFNMSHKYFCRFFKSNFRKTFVEYLNDVRIEKALALLDNGLSVTESALSCGFSNMSYFTLVFKRKIGITPSKYRKNGYISL